MSSEHKSSGNRRQKATALALFALVAGMVCLSFAAVPLYNMFCRVTGYGGTTQRAEAASDQVLDRTVTVRFDSNMSGSLPWSVKPEQTRLKLRIGETGTMVYVARNTSDAATIGTSTFNVSPPAAGYYFNKIQCFCFTEQPLGPNETADMPVVFFVDPAFAEDKDTRDLSEITLSYTFFPVEADGEDPARPVASVPDGSDKRPL
ncbi:cytochrome c oxidase assembly protein [Microbaculum marinum]|uniref:Cytochrome c oxidase assembly protein CtaG n=1 Tax=Microbaculum marinum TaxID=1764581 RepID=A0AAW9RPN6_9HYPH